MTSFLSEHKKTHDCGALRAANVGEQVVLMGWVGGRRDLGGCVFVDLRDRGGVTQVMFDPNESADLHASAGELRTEYCIGIVGKVISRGSNTNKKMATGEIEIIATELEVFSRSETPPFLIEDDIDSRETLRLTHRYLDLRRPRFQRNLMTRCQAVQAARNYLVDNGFSDIETPFMVKYTPGGARNFMVPSRLNPGCFYALAESPQIYKQLLMVGGFERYYQVVRCFRDEDLRGDRQPEFTQIDIEMSFIEELDLQIIIEGMLAKIWKDVLDVDVPTPFLRMTFAEAMDKYGCDKPDLRLDLTLCDVSEGGRISGFRVFEGIIADGGMVKCMRVPDGGRLSRKQLDSLATFAKPHGVKGVSFARVDEGGSWRGSLAKSFSDEGRARVNEIAGAVPGDVLLFVADKPRTANSAMAAIRLHIGALLGLIRADEWRFMWLIDPPLFEHSEEEDKLVAMHHPFTSPRVEDEQYLESDPERVLARAYDVVLNGVELGGGSIRIHRPELQARCFKALGISDEEAEQKFGFLLKAFRFGPPPHGGVAFGLDRMAMLLTGSESLRDVLAFPKTQRGADLMTDSPTPVTDKQLEELYVKVDLSRAKK